MNELDQFIEDVVKASKLSERELCRALHYAPSYLNSLKANAKTIPPDFLIRYSVLLRIDAKKELALHKRAAKMAGYQIGSLNKVKPFNEILRTIVKDRHALSAGMGSHIAVINGWLRGVAIPYPDKINKICDIVQASAIDRERLMTAAAVARGYRIAELAA